MISLEQILFLQSKVETVVNRLNVLNAENAQLKSENDALRSKCAELTNALSEKSELVSNLEADQSKIEEGILLALNRLNTVENTVLTNSGSSASVATTGTSSPVEEAPQKTPSEPQKEALSSVQDASEDKPAVSAVSAEPPAENSQSESEALSEEPSLPQEQTEPNDGAELFATKAEVQNEPSPDMARFEQEALFGKTELPPAADSDSESTIDNSFDIF